MKHKTWFRLVLKLMGVWMFVNGLEMAFANVLQLTVTLTQTWPGPRAPAWYLIPGVLTSIAHLAIGAYLFFGGKWIVDLAIPSNRPYCHECGYDLTSAAGHACSECGTPFKSEVIPAA